MQEVFDHFATSKGGLVCTAKEVYANNVTVIGGPPSWSCERGEYIYVNISASIHFNTDRYDPAIYTASSNCIVDNTANNCAIDGKTCAVDVLGPEDAIPGKIENADQDSCYDVVENGYDLNGFVFQNNLKLLCDE